MEWLLEYLPILAILISGYSVYKNNQTKKEVEVLKHSNERKERLNQHQKAMLFIIQNITNNAIKLPEKLKNQSDLEEKISIVMKSKKFEGIFEMDIYKSPIYALNDEIGLSTCSEKVMILRLYIQETSKIKHENSMFIVMAYSVLYKYLYKDFTGNNIDDYYLVKYNVSDYYESEDLFVSAREQIYDELSTSYDWMSLKN